MGRPNSSPRAARTAGADCTTTCLVGSARAAQTLSVSSFSDRAPVGQAAMHWPQLMQAGIRQGHAPGGGNLGVHAAHDGADDAHLLHLFAHGGHSGGTECTWRCCARWPGRRYPPRRWSWSRRNGFRLPRHIHGRAAAARNWYCGRRTGTSCRDWKAAAPGWFCGWSAAGEYWSLR